MTKAVSKRDFDIIDVNFAGETDVCNLFLVILHRDRAQVLLSTDNSQLPCIHVKPWRQFHFQKTILWVPKVRERFGFRFDVTFLRCLWYKGYGCSDEGYLYQAVLLLESHKDVTEPPQNTQWEELSHLPIPHPDAGDAMQALIEECRTTSQPPLRPLYDRQGWFQEMRSWMELQLVKSGFDDIREVNQVKWTYRGTVIQANTNRGLVFLKCSPFFVNEALIAEMMSRLLPEHVETPIAIDVDKRLLLMRDYGEIIVPILMNRTESEQWALQLAKIHQATAHKEEILQQAGLKLIPVEMLPTKLKDILELVESLKYVSADVLEQFKELWPEIRSDCRVVQEIGVPVTFIHGDITLDNVYRPAVAGGHYGMIDWAHTAISHPFFDAFECNLSAYLGSWHSFLSRTRPESSETITLDRLFDCHYLCFRLESLFHMVKLYLETVEVESPMPLAMRTEMGQTMEYLVRTYAKNKRSNEFQDPVVNRIHTRAAPGFCLIFVYSSCYAVVHVCITCNTVYCYILCIIYSLVHI